MRITLAVAVLGIFSVACSGNGDGSVRSVVTESQAAWESVGAAGNYTYHRSFLSTLGRIQCSIDVTVTGGVITSADHSRVEFEQAPTTEACLPELTVDEMYAICLEEVVPHSERPGFNLAFETDENGVLALCTTFPDAELECHDDCASGVWIDSLTLL